MEKKKRSVVKWVLLIVLLLLLLCVAAAYGYMQYQLSKINRVEVVPYADADIFEQDTDAADTLEEDALDWGDPTVVTQVDGVCNILLIGQDSRDAEHERGRSDSMILLSINKNTEQISMISLMRDMYVQIPGYSNNRINAAYAMGGAELLDATVETNFGVRVDYNVEVDFQAFQDLVNILGGVEINLYQEEADYINNATGGALTAGVNLLNGEEALSYARCRYVGQYDFERTLRQRTVLQAIYDKGKNQSLATILKMYDAVAGNLTVDMTNNQILALITSAYNLRQNSMNSYRLPADNLYTNEIIRGMEVLVCTDWNAQRQQLYEYLYGEPDAVQ